MSKNIIVAVADKGYLPHVYSLFGNLRNLGCYTGDLGLVYNGEIDSETYKYLHERNIKILNVPECYCFFAKFYVFHPFFKQWERALYLDTDMIIKGSVDEIFEQEGDLLLDIEEFEIWRYLQNNDNELLNELRSWFTHLDDFGYNTSSILYNTNILKGDEVSKLFDLSNKYKVLNKHTGLDGGTEQPILNFFWYDFPIKQIKKISFVNRPADSKILHTTRWLFPFGEYYDKGLEFFKDLK